MDREKYVEYLCSTFQKNFSIEKNKKVMGQKFLCFGKWSMEYGRTLLTKDRIVDKYRCDEYCFIDSVSELTEEKLSTFKEYLKQGTVDLVEANKEHKSTYITGILVVDRIENEKIKKSIRKFTYSKYYKFSFNGWSEVRLAVVEIGDKQIYNNKACNELVKNLYFNK